MLYPELSRKEFCKYAVYSQHLNGLTVDRYLDHVEKHDPVRD